jgi:hypothetical protein
MPSNASLQPQNTYGATVSQTSTFAYPEINPSLNGAVLGDIEDGDKPRLAIRAAIDGARAAAETALFTAIPNGPRAVSTSKAMPPPSAPRRPL